MKQTTKQDWKKATEKRNPKRRYIFKAHDARLKKKKTSPAKKKAEKK